MQHISAFFNKTRSSTPSERARASLKMPAGGCFAVIGHRKLKKLSRSIKELQAVEDKLHCGINNLIVCQATEQEAMGAARSDLIWQRRVLQQQVEQLQQQIEAADSVILEIQVLFDGTVKCSATAVQLQPANQPAPSDQSSDQDDVIAPTRRSCSTANNKSVTSEVQSVDDESLVESAGQDASRCCGSSELDISDADASCNVVLADIKLHGDVQGSIRTYTSKLAEWCKKALVINNVTETKRIDVANKVSSRWRGSSNNGRRSTLLDWGSAFTSFRKSSSVSSS